MAHESRPPLLVELFVEELPPKALKKLGAAFAERLVAALQAQSLVAAATPMTPFATPRRLAVLIDAVAARAPERDVSHKLMPVSVGLSAAGEATPALLKKLAALGADASVVPGLQRRPDGKSETLFLDSVATGASLAEGLQRALEQAIAQLPIPKVMQYQLADGWTSVSFVRPAHGLVALHGDEIVPVRVLGLDAGRTTFGHRFEASVAPIVLRSAGSYEAQLRDEGAVIASFEQRRAEIVRQLQAAAAVAASQPIDDDALLDEVTALVERPNVLACEFESEYLAVPPECLVLTMKANQKYFPLLDPSGALTNRFLVVSNITPADPGRIIEGNERVVRPRLADAKFFFDQDRKRTLESRVPALDKVVYHGKLGSQGERVQRVRAIARGIGAMLGDPELAARVDRAGLLAKADLTTDMVGEFPELQGIMGRYYALHDDESGDVGFAIEDHYRPRFAGDALPRNEVGVVLALADKLETVVGLFGIGQWPSGDSDPFALRRHALGIVRLLVERNLPLSLLDVVDLARDAMPATARGDWLPPFQFIVDRATGYFEDQGFDRRAVASILGPHSAKFPLGQLPDLLREASLFIASPEGQVLAEANKRITNILKKSGGRVPFGVSPRDLSAAPDSALFQYDEERSLFAALLSAGEASLALRSGRQFAEALSALAPLSAPTKAFFDKVMVNVDDEKIRDNRITLLQHAWAYMNQVADLTLMAT
jgi:glycyl-tRNA synthetase beta chain